MLTDLSDSAVPDPYPTSLYWNNNWGGGWKRCSSDQFRRKQQQKRKSFLITLEASRFSTAKSRQYPNHTTRGDNHIERMHCPTRTSGSGVSRERTYCCCSYLESGFMTSNTSQSVGGGWGWVGAVGARWLVGRQSLHYTWRPLCAVFTGVASCAEKLGSILRRLIVVVSATLEPDIY